MAELTLLGDASEAPRSPRRAEPDAHGQAALLLAESTLHVLMDVGVLSFDQAMDAVRTACEVKVDVARETDESTGRMQQSLNLLAAIERSLIADGGGVRSVS